MFKEFSATTTPSHRHGFANTPTQHVQIVIGFLDAVIAVGLVVLAVQAWQLFVS